jgi:hypothetical protein
MNPVNKDMFLCTKCGADAFDQVHSSPLAEGYHKHQQRTFAAAQCPFPWVYVVLASAIAWSVGIFTCSIFIAAIG